MSFIISFTAGDRKRRRRRRDRWGCDGSGLANCVTWVEGIKDEAENRADKY
jgi:hypothetical protein